MKPTPLYHKTTQPPKSNQGKPTMPASLPCQHAKITPSAGGGQVDS